MRGVILGLAVIALASAPSEAQPVLFVNQNASGANDGSSWADAFTDLQTALDRAEQSPGEFTEIWVAAGTYKPSKRLDPSDPRSATYMLINGVSLYGGFAGGETTTEGRDRHKNRTVLNGDLNGDDQADFVNYSENAIHVVIARNVDEATAFDGFRVAGGYAMSPLYLSDRGAGMLIEAAWPTIRNCVFERNFAGRVPGNVAHDRDGGGAVYIALDTPVPEARPIIFRDCEFTDNSTLGFGGAIFTYDAGLELERCYFTRNSAMQGGAVWADYANALTLRNSHFVDNRAAGGSGAVGGIFLQTTIESCSFQRNSAPYGGAASLGGPVQLSNSWFQANTAELEGGALRLSTNPGSEVTNCGFRDNSSKIGGAIRSLGTLLVTGTTFNNNTANSDGGAIYARSSLDAVDCWMQQNTAGGLGGAVLLEYGRMEMTRTDIRENSAQQGGGIAVLRGTLRMSDCLVLVNNAFLGGGVSNDGQSALLERTMLVENFAQFGAGFSHVGGGPTILVNCGIFDNWAFYYGGGILGGTSRLQLRSCTVAGNSAGTRGAGILVGADTVISNSVLWGNVASSRSDESAQVDGIELAELEHNDIQGWSIPDDPGGNFGLDPLFFDPQKSGLWPTIKYGLRAESPCVNAGIEDVIDWGVWQPPPAQDFDLIRRPRVLCKRVDIGALEYGVVGDVDCDSDFDLDDFPDWSQCARGPNEPGLCPVFDTDGDADLDLHDLYWLLPDLLQPEP